MERDGESRPFFCYKLRGSRNIALFCYPTTNCATVRYARFSLVVKAETQTLVP